MRARPWNSSLIWLSASIISFALGDFLILVRRHGNSAPPATEPMQIGVTHLSGEERERRVRLNLCLYCGLPGHIRASCPTRPSRNNATVSQNLSQSTFLKHTPVHSTPVNSTRLNRTTMWATENFSPWKQPSRNGVTGLRELNTPSPFWPITATLNIWDPPKDLTTGRQDGPCSSHALILL